jgi:hypothetical protein
VQTTRVTDLAHELKVKSRQVLDALAALGMNTGKTYSSSLRQDEVESVRAFITRDIRLAHTRSRNDRKSAELSPNLRIDLSRVSKPANLMENTSARKAIVDGGAFGSQSVLRPERIVEVLMPLTNLLPMSVMQDCLAESGFIERTGGREALQRRCGNIGQFWEMIGGALKSRSASESGLSVLRQLAVYSLNTSVFPQPATRALRKCQQALEKSDVGALVQLLAELEAFRDFPGLSSPRVLMYVLAKSESARQTMAKLNRLRDLLFRENLSDVQVHLKSNGIRTDAPVPPLSDQHTPSQKQTRAGRPPALAALLPLSAKPRSERPEEASSSSAEQSGIDLDGRQFRDRLGFPEKAKHSQAAKVWRDFVDSLTPSV